MGNSSGDIPLVQSKFNTNPIGGTQGWTMFLTWTVSINVGWKVFPFVCYSNMYKHKYDTMIRLRNCSVYVSSVNNNRKTKQ